MAKIHVARSKLLHWGLALLLTCVVVVIAAVAWLVRLDHLVTREFQGRHWSVPARVYAAPLELYVGAHVSANDLEEELARIHYRPGDPSTGPGLYRRRGNSYDLHARRVRFIDELRDPQRVSISGDSNSITGLKSADGSELAVFRLDPPVIGSVFPIHGEDRLVLSPADIPPVLRSGIKLIEDRRFDEHHGVDAHGIARAVWANLRAGRVVQGGSTLTQQLVKNYFLSDEQSFGRKGTEALMALRLEAHFSKEEILVAYLNEVYLGQDGSRAIHGFGLGSEYYFAKPLDELDIGELAMLIGLVKGPSYYDPRKHPDRARARRNLVLQRFADAHLIDATDAKRAAAVPLTLRPPGGSYVPAYLDLVRRHLKRDYAEADLAAAGLAVYTSLEPRAQAAAERALTLNLKRLDAASRVRDAHLEGAVIVAEPNSGDVVAVVGGRDVGTDGFNRALDARRPIGSLVKPAVYLTALETGRYNAATLIEDAPIELKLSDGSVWAPQNFEHQVYGRVPMARALAESMNLATVRLGLDLGLPKVAATLQRLGLDTPPTLNPSLLLGTVEMTPLEVVQVYTALANGGFRARLRAVHAVVDEHGRPLKTFKVQVEEAAPSAAVYQLDRMLMLVTTNGTARDVGSYLPKGMVVAGKTGTSSDTRDSWFAGFTGSYIAVAWVGYDDNRVTGLTGAAGAMPVWAGTVASLKSASFQPVPPELVEDRWIGFSDGLETTSACSADSVVVSVPKGAVLPARPGCISSPNSTATDKIKAWLKNLVH
ncbi:MAG TPA: penicillin-binding protein 1B [Steroidobacteraceae bacterium]|nr:penicillin-binding protein 1B [Steroidobacteraceae bacterium]